MPIGSASPAGVGAHSNAWRCGSTVEPSNWRWVDSGGGGSAHAASASAAARETGMVVVVVMGASLEVAARVGVPALAATAVVPLDAAAAAEVEQRGEDLDAAREPPGDAQ